MFLESGLFSMCALLPLYSKTSTLPLYPSFLPHHFVINTAALLRLWKGKSHHVSSLAKSHPLALYLTQHEHPSPFCLLVLPGSFLQLVSWLTLLQPCSSSHCYSHMPASLGWGLSTSSPSFSPQRFLLQLLFLVKVYLTT